MVGTISKAPLAWTPIAVIEEPRRQEVWRRRSPSLVIDSPTNTTVPPTIPVGTDRAAE
jgi:hypothetical protein